MRITIAAIGSTGDVLPYLGLGRELSSRGHEVTVATHRSFEPFVTDAGLSYAFVPMEPGEHASDEVAERMRRGPRAAAAAIRDMFGPWAWEMALAVDAACDKADHVLLSAMAWTGVHSADARGLPSAGVHLQPMEPTGEFAPAALGARSFGAALNRAIGRKAQRMMVEPYLDVVNGIRRRHGMPAVTADGHLRALRERDWPVLHGFSPALVPRPTDWRPGLRVVGTWWPPQSQDWAPDPALEDFLAAGEPPIYVGFGSTLPAPADRLAAMVGGLCRDLGVRAVVHAGWVHLRGVAGAGVHTVEHVPHGWLFPRVRAAVHHAGAGTTAAALRAGIPSVPVPSTLDQPFWAERAHRVGAATRPVPARRLTTERLAAAVRQAVEDGALRVRAREMAARLGRENGAAVAADLLAASPG